MSAISLVPKGASLQEQVSLVRALQVQVQTAEPQEAATTADQARQAREWIKVSRGAARLAREALRLECMALRRLGELGEDGIKFVPKNYRRAAKVLGGATQEEFDRALGEVDSWVTARSVSNRIEGKEQERHPEWQYLSDAANGKGKVVLKSSTELSLAAEVVINSLVAGAETFTVAGAAEALATHLGLARPSPVVVEGLRGLVREAAKLASTGSSSPEPLVDANGEAITPPQIVTWEDDGEWLRMPWTTATIENIRFMADYRMGQAKSVLEAAENLDRLVAVLDAAHDLEPHVESCEKLLEIARREGGVHER